MDISTANSNNEVISETEIPYAYNMLNMCVDNLQWILFGELTHRYEYHPQEDYARKGESVEYGSMTKMIEMAGDMVYGDIYRK